MSEETEERTNLREEAQSQLLHVSVPASGVITGAGERDDEVED